MILSTQEVLFQMAIYFVLLLAVGTLSIVYYHFLKDSKLVRIAVSILFSVWLVADVFHEIVGLL